MQKFGVPYFLRLFSLVIAVCCNEIILNEKSNPPAILGRLGERDFYKWNWRIYNVRFIKGKCRECKECTADCFRCKQQRTYGGRLFCR